MTARTQMLEKANADTQAAATIAPQLESPSRDTTENGLQETYNMSKQSLPHNGAAAGVVSVVRATWTGKHLILTGFPPDKLTAIWNRPPQPSGSKSSKSAAQNGSPAKTPRNARKRKRAGTNGSITGSPAGDFVDESPSRRDDDDAGSSSGNASGPLYGQDGGSEADADAGTTQGPTRKRRRRGERLLEQALLAARDPTPELPLIPEEDDILLDVELPGPFLSRSPSPDPDDPDDEASKIYRSSFVPLTPADVFLAALSRINPAQRRDEVLYKLAANTAMALRAWQDEYLEIDKLTAPHAPIPRKAATANRQPLSPTLHQDLKEADIYDYVFDSKKVGHQDPIAQRILRDASGRELRQRAPKTRITADSLLMHAATTLSEDEIGRRRARRPVSKYDGIVNEASRRGRLGGRGRGRGRGRGGRGGASSLLDRRIREMREASAVTATSASAEDDSASENGAAGLYSREGSMAPSLAESYNDNDDDETYQVCGVRGSRPKGSKATSKGPRPPPSNAEFADGQTRQRSDSQYDTPLSTTGPGSTSPSKQAQQAKATGSKGPKSEKRSSSMTAWWAKRKAAAAEARGKTAEGGQSELAPNTKVKTKLESIAQKPIKVEVGGHYGMPQSQVPPGVPLSAYQHGSAASLPPHYQYGPNGYNNQESPATGYQSLQQHHYAQPAEVSRDPYHQPLKPAQHRPHSHQVDHGPPRDIPASSSSRAPPHASQYQPAYNHSYAPHASAPLVHQRQAAAAPLYQNDPRSRGTLPGASPPAHHRSPSLIQSHMQDNRMRHDLHARQLQPTPYQDSAFRERAVERHDAARHNDDTHRPPQHYQQVYTAQNAHRHDHGGYYGGSAVHDNGTGRAAPPTSVSAAGRPPSPSQRLQQPPPPSLSGRYGGQPSLGDRFGGDKY